MQRKRPPKQNPDPHKGKGKIPENKFLGVIDAETDPFKIGRIPLPFAWGFYRETENGLKYTYYWGESATRQLFRDLEQFNGIVYAHNGGKFDYFYLMEFLPDYPEVMSINGRIAKLKFDKCELRDSYLIIPTKLKETGEKDEIDYELMESDKREENREEILSYLKQDCIALFDTVKEFISTYGLGLTIRNRAFDQLNRMEIKPPVSNENTDELFRKYYYGGRCECFESGKIVGNIQVFDINSAYPFAMIHKHAWGLSKVILSELPNNREMIGRCFITLECCSKGAFPERKKDGGIHFPEKQGIYHVTGWEYLAAKDLGLITHVKIIVCIVPMECQSLEKFVSKFYAQKKLHKSQGKKQQYLFDKLMLNSCYGGFCMNPRKHAKSKMVPIGEFPEQKESYDFEWEEKLEIPEAGFMLFERPINIKERRFFNVATGASITGFVRAYLLRAIHARKRPLYCDTDSVIFDASNDSLSGFKIGDELGEWEKEAEGSEIYIGGKKLYAMRRVDGSWKTASKGVSLSPDEIISVCEGKIVEWESIAPSYSLRKPFTTNRENDTVSAKLFVKRKVRITA